MPGQRGFTRPAYRFPQLIALLVCLGLVWTPASAAAAPPKKLDDQVRQALSGWDVLKNNIAFKRLKTRTIDGVAIATGKATAFELKVDVEARSKGTSLHQLALTFPRRKQLTTDAFVALFGADVREHIPPGVGAGFAIERLDVDFFDNRPAAIRVTLNGGTWAPFGGRELAISKLRITAALLDPLGAKDLELRLGGETTLPKKLAKYLGMGATTLAMSGQINTRSKSLLLRVDLATELPLGKAKSVVLQGAHLRLTLDGRGPALALGGRLGVRPAKGGPLDLRGEVAINLTGEIFAQGWNEGVWSNPLGVSPRLHILGPGIGFGADFTAVPWPMPILAVRGGLAVGADPARPDFGGQVLVGVHGGDPTQNVVDAQLDALSLYDLVKPFAPGGVPTGLVKPLKDINLTNARLTIVPPGPGVTLFDVYYEPGFLVRGDLQIDTFRGKLFADVSPWGVEAFAQISPIRFPGFALTSADGAAGPMVYVVAKESNKALVLNGALDVLGVKRSADVYLSKKGFSVTLAGSVLGIAEATLDVAGSNPFKGGGLWVSAEMKADFLSQLTASVERQIEADTKKTRQDFENAKTTLARERERLRKLDERAKKARAAARADLTKRCNAFEVDDRSRAAKAAEKKQLDDTIARLDADIRSLQDQIHRLQTKAVWKKKSLTPLGCNKRQIWDPIHGGGCYRCPDGFARDTAVHIEKHGGCTRPTAHLSAQLATKTADVATRRADRDVVQKALRKLEKGVNTAGRSACTTLANAPAIDELPGVKAVLKDRPGITGLIDIAEGIRKGSEFVTISGLNTAKWFVKQGGEAAGILKVKRAWFSGCVNAVAGGSLEMNIDATFADTPIKGSFKLDSSDVAAGFSALAKRLLKHGKPVATKQNGTCTRPTVERPKAGAQPIARRVNALQQKQKKGSGAKAQPKVEQPKAWVRTKREDHLAGNKPGERATIRTRQPERARDHVALCKQKVQDKIAWDYQGSKRWPAPALQALCQGTLDGTQPGQCFNAVMHGGIDWGGGTRWNPKNVIELCGGTRDAIGTVDCVKQAIAEKLAWQVALKQCRRP